MEEDISEPAAAIVRTTPMDRFLSVFTRIHSPFSVEAKDAIEASVIGDFNNWNVAEGALSKLKNGTFKGVFDLKKDAAYEFKYVIDGVFVNEPEAGSFKFNEFAGNENGVLVV